MPKLILSALLFMAFPWSASGLVRMAVVLGNNSGLPEDKTLSFATRDAEQVYATLLQLGGLDKGQGYLLLDPSVAKVRTVFRECRNRVRALQATGEKVQLLIYFSGHGSDRALHMEGEALPLDEIRSYFRETEADLKVLIADACYSGSLIQSKGAVLSDPIPVRFLDDLKVNGSAILTSSSAGELSQESRDLQGSLFTHFFVSAIRGAADNDHDGQVTLWEAYNHTQYGMRRRLASRKQVAQTPEFDVNIKGSGNVVLSRLEMGQARLKLKGLPRGEYRILEAVSALQVAEVTLSEPEGAVLALPRATYLIYHDEGKVGMAGHADLRRSANVVLGPGDFSRVTAGTLASKGMIGPGTLSLLGRTPVMMSLQPRLYTEFPGRNASALALEASVQWNLKRWGLVGSGAILPPVWESARGNSLVQTGLGVSG
ncbi:MAG: caspase family protein, partial [Fibrobacterota bacterium]|nr:caspase family protein [Fibrobacterota bacterium]